MAWGLKLARAGVHLPKPTVTGVTLVPIEVYSHFSIQPPCERPGIRIFEKRGGERETFWVFTQKQTKNLHLAKRENPFFFDRGWGFHFILFKWFPHQEYLIPPPSPPPSQPQPLHAHHQSPFHFHAHAQIFSRRARAGAVLPARIPPHGRCVAQVG